MTQGVNNNSLQTPTSSAEAAPISPLSAGLPLPSSEGRGEVLATAARAAASVDKLNVFEFTDYRVFLAAFYEWKKSQNGAYSMSTFIRRAGLGANSRGYLKLIIDGKRNLTPHTIRRFIDALGLTAKEALYFENLVLFNQAKTTKDRDYYFNRLSASADGRETSQFELLRSQYHYYSNWYYVAVRELVGLDHFEEDLAWICAQLRGKIGKREAQEALTHLERLGMIRLDAAKGRFVQAESLVKYPGGVFNEIMQKFHSEMLERARESLIEDPYDDRNVSSVTLSCDSDSLPELKKAVNAFRDQMCLKFGVGAKKTDAVFQINVQLFQLTAPKKKGEKK